MQTKDPFHQESKMGPVISFSKGYVFGKSQSEFTAANVT